jgi:hypothetical protein
MGTVQMDTSYSDIVNNLVLQVFLVATIVVLLLISVEPRSSLIPAPILRALTGAA